MRADLKTDEDAGRIHFQAGREYYADGRYEQAFNEFVEAYRLTGRPELLFNRGRCFEALRHDAEALACYREYLSSALSLDRVEPERRAREIEHRLGGAKVPAGCSEQLPRRELAAAAAAAHKPLYRRWWFWVSIVGGAAVVAGATTAAVLATRPSDAPLFPPVTP